MSNSYVNCKGHRIEVKVTGAKWSKSVKLRSAVTPVLSNIAKKTWGFGIWRMLGWCGRHLYHVIGSDHV